MNIKTVDMLNAVESLKKLGAKEVPAKVSYRLARLAKKFQSEIKVFEAKRFELLKKYGEEVADKKGFWQCKPENIEPFQQDMSDMLEQPVEIDFTKIPLEMFGDVKLEARDLAALDDFIEE